jgi:hypothetical protein
MFSRFPKSGTESLKPIPTMAEEVVEMIRWSPSTELANLHGAMDRLFEDFSVAPRPLATEVASAR